MHLSLTGNEVEGEMDRIGKDNKSGLQLRSAKLQPRNV